MSEIVISFCWAGIHNWSNWEDVVDKECGNHQVRTCKYCKKKRYTTVVVGHEWSKWTEGSTTNVYDKNTSEAKGDYPTSRFLVQRRTCIKCGQTDARETKV